MQLVALRRYLRQLGLQVGDRLFGVGQRFYFSRQLVALRLQLVALRRYVRQLRFQVGDRLFGVGQRGHLGGQVVAGGLQFIALGGDGRQIALQRRDGVLRVFKRGHLLGERVAFADDLLERGLLFLLTGGQLIQLALQIVGFARIFIARSFRFVQQHLRAAQFLLRGLQIGLQLRHLIGKRLRAAAALRQLGFLFGQQRLLARQLVLRVGQLGERVVIVLRAGFQRAVGLVQTALQIGDGVQTRLIARAQLRRLVLGGLKARLQIADRLIHRERVLHVGLRVLEILLRLLQLALRFRQPVAERRGFLVARLELIGQRFDGRLRFGQRVLRFRQLCGERIGAGLQRAERLAVRLIERVLVGQFLIELIALRRHARKIAPRRSQLRAEHGRRADRRGQRDRQQYRQCPFHGSTLLYRYERHCPYSIRLQYTIFLFP